MICLVVLNMEVSPFDWTPPFFTPLQLFGNPELLSYNAAFTPSCVKQGWGPPAELWIQFRRHLSPGIRRKYCYCFPNEPPSSSRLPTHISTNNHQCQSTLQQTKGKPPSSLYHQFNNPLALQPWKHCSIPTCPVGFKRGSKHFQSAAWSIGRYMPKLTWLQLPLARSRIPHPYGWRILLGQQVPWAPITTLFALLSHRRGMYRHMQECGLYELYAKALKVTHKKNEVAFKDKYFKLHTVLAKSCFCNMVLPLHGFLILIDPFSSGLSLFYLGLSHLPSSNFESLAPTHPVTAFPQRQTKPLQQIPFIHSPAMKGENSSKKFW